MGSIGCTIGVLIYGGGAVIRHYTLRLILALCGYTPWNFIRFLDQASERVFLRKVGGGYTFYHSLVREHFASLEDGPRQVSGEHTIFDRSWQDLGKIILAICFVIGVLYYYTVRPSQ